jgi:nitroreductase
MLLPLPPVSLDPGWYDAIPTRISRRVFDGRSVAPDLLERLRAHCERFHPVPGVRVAIAPSAPENIFTGYAGSYGRVRGFVSVAAFIGPDRADTAAGYVGEAFVLEATRLGLDTCWVAGSYDRKRTAAVFTVAGDERIYSITPVGYATAKQAVDEKAMRTLVRSASRKPLSEIAPGASDWPDWARSAAESARLAPTGGNGQPARLRLDGGSLVIATADTTYWTAPIDFGIVMLHAELGALREGVTGVWDAATPPGVARFTPAG